MSSNPQRASPNLESLRGRKVLIVAGGVGGDSLPFAALSEYLGSIGCEVELALSPLASLGLRRLRVKSRPVGLPIERSVLQKRRSLTFGLDEGTLSWIVAIERFFLPWSESSMGSLMELVSEADLVLTHPLAMGSYEAAERVGKKCITLQLFPSLSPAGLMSHSKDGLTEMSSDNGRRHDRLVKLLSSPPQDSALGTRSYWDRWGEADVLNLIESKLGMAMGIHGTCVGLPRMPQSVTPITSEMVHFLRASGPPIVIVCQGSLLGRTRPYLNHLAVEGLVRHGFRVLVLGANSDDMPTSDNARSTEFLNFEHAANQAVAVVHHAGAGTLRCAVAAGLPAISVPGPFDTKWNSRAFSRLGLVVEHPEAAPWVTSERLSESVSDLLSNSAIRDQVVADQRSFSSHVALGSIAGALTGLS